MLNRYKFLYDIYNNKLPNINIEYIKYYKHFNSNKIYTFFPLLVPKQETTKIIYILKNIYSNNFTFLILDLGCGTGTILICLDIKFRYMFYNSMDKIYLSIKSSKKNIKKYINNLNIWCNWFYSFFYIKRYNLILTNPPYISYYDFAYYFNNYHVTIKNSLVASNKGYTDIYNIIKFTYDLLHINGIILIEHNYSQSKKIRNLMHCCGFNNIFTYKDLNRLNRITYAEK